MRKYCKAYKLGALRQFSSWAEKPGEDRQELSDDEICYLWDDYTVIKSPIQDEGILFDEVTSEWKDFCQRSLGFEIPEDLLYAYKQPSEQEDIESV